MTKFSESVICKIKGEHICPLPRWCFLLKDCVFWFLLVVSVVLGSVSFSVVVHLINFGDLDMIGHLHGNLMTSIIMMLPYFWMFSLVVFAAVAYYNWKHTKLGYRFKRRWIIIVSVFASIVLGSMLYTFGLGKKIDMMMINAMPFYDESRHSARQKIWLQPENGLLVGKVVHIDDVQSIVVIRDESGVDWNVVSSEMMHKTNAIIRKGKVVKIIGKKEGEHEFSAIEIRRCGDCQKDEE